MVFWSVFQVILLEKAALKGTSAQCVTLVKVSNFSM